MRVPPEIIKVIRGNKSFLITSHIRPDGDAIGSQLALYHILRRIDKRVVIQNESRMPENFRFLPGAGRIRACGSLPFRPGVALILDSPALARSGRVRSQLKNIPLLINIDHHVSNEFFGDLNWVRTDSSSVGEMMCALARSLKIKLTRPIALCLYVALLTDMGKFQFMVTPRDGVRVLHLAAALVSLGLVPYEIYKKVYNLYSIDQLKLLGRVLNTLGFRLGGQIAFLTVSEALLRRYRMDDDNTDTLISQPRDILTTRVAILFTAKDGRVKVSWRSKEPSLIDVNKIAGKFGGGGHPAAAGADVPGDLETVKRKVLKVVSEELKRINAVGSGRGNLSRAKSRDQGLKMLRS